MPTWQQGGEGRLVAAKAIGDPMRTIFAGFVFCLLVGAQQPHTVTLNWQDALNPAGTTYSVYRANGLCSGTPTFSKIATAVTAKTYQDTTVQPGNYCYAVTATFNAVESAQSNTTQPAVPAFAPTTLTHQVAIVVPAKGVNNGRFI